MVDGTSGSRFQLAVAILPRTVAEDSCVVRRGAHSDL